MIFALAFAGSNTAGWYHNPAFVQGLVAWAPRPRFTSIRGHAPASGCCEVRLSRAQPHVQLPSNNKTRSPTRRGRSRRKSLHAWTHASSGGGSVSSNRSTFTFRERPNLVTTTSHFFFALFDFAPSPLAHGAWRPGARAARAGLRKSSTRRCRDLCKRWRYEAVDGIRPSLQRGRGKRLRCCAT